MQGHVGTKIINQIKMRALKQVRFRAFSSYLKSVTNIQIGAALMILIIR